MKVIAAINGTVTSESMAMYAIRYAQSQKFTLLLLHIENEKDDLVDVNASMDRLTILALSKDVQCEHVLLKGSLSEVMQNFISTIYVDVIFCSTRKHKKYITDSFSDALRELDLNVDIAVVRIVKINNMLDVHRILLPIKEDKLSVKKFTFFATLLSAYKAEGEVYSISSMSRRELSSINRHDAKEKFTIINYNLRHYSKPSNIIPLNFHIKHDITDNEANSILSYMVKSNSQLAIIGAKRLSVSSFFKRESIIEKLMRESTINIIAYYPKEY